jgi:hypothetical protein
MVAEAFVDQTADSMDWTNTLLILTSDHANAYMRLMTDLGLGELAEQVGYTCPNGDVTYGTGGTQMRW